MGKFRIEIKELAQKHIKLHYKSGDKKSIKNIEKIIQALSETPCEGFGQPEALKYELTGFWSRRINQKDRLIYSIDNDIVTVYIVSAMRHYSDK